MGDKILEYSVVFKGECVRRVNDVPSFVVDLTTGPKDIDL